jgi:effector-binding domain-containing protein
MRFNPTLLLLLILPLPSMANEQAFPPTPAGRSELKTLPAGTLLKAAGSGNYFEQSNRLFRPLFRYISANDIKMTVPVEAQIEGAAMYFWVAPSEIAKVGPARDGVEVIQIPERRVAALGARGSYTPANFAKTRDALQVWLAKQPQLEATGPAYAVFWHGPFTLWFDKEYEVHVPVKTTD